MRMVRRALVFWMWVAICACAAHAQSPEEQKLLDLMNETRTEAGLPPVAWDAGLAAAAHAHAVHMTAEPAMAHQYEGEPDLAQRSAAAGAHFSLIEENIAVGDTPQRIHDEWMHSQMHRENLMNPKINRVGLGVARAHGQLYAVADFAVGVASLTREQVEATVGKLLQAHGLTLMTENAGARRYCELPENEAGASLGLKARFLMRWQSADLDRLPQVLEQRIAGGGFHQATVGACAPHGDSGAGGPVFSGYRVGVLLY